MKAAIATALLTVISCNPSFSQQADQNRGPSYVVERFCQLDFNGVRLSSATRGPIDSLLAEEYGFEPGWDAVLVINGYHITRVESVGDSASVHVKYDLLGKNIIGRIWIEADSSFHSPETWERMREVDFYLRRTDQGWKITGPVIPPHVSLKIVGKPPPALIENRYKTGHRIRPKSR